MANVRNGKRKRKNTYSLAVLGNSVYWWDVFTATNTEKEKTQKTAFKPARFKQSYEIPFLRHLFSSFFLNGQSELLFFLCGLVVFGSNRPLTHGYHFASKQVNAGKAGVKTKLFLFEDFTWLPRVYSINHVS